MENLFKGLDKELREAIFEVNNPEVTYKFYTKFYFQLIKIDSFLNYIYEYEDQRPFEDFIDRFDKDRLEASFGEIQKYLVGLDFINAEKSLTRLLIYYYKKRGVNIWEYPDITLSKNINIPVFINILKAYQEDLKEHFSYETILRKSLDYIDDKEYLIKKVRYKKRTYYNSISFYNFMYHHLLLPLEVKRYPFRDKEGNYLPFSNLVKEKNKIILDSEKDISGRKKVDGNLRQMFCDKLLKFDLFRVFISQAQTATDFSFKNILQHQREYLLRNVIATIFLPNSPFNNASDDFALYKYNKMKLELFLKLKQSLSKTQNSKLITSLLASLLKLNKSFRSGALQLPFYIITDDIYRNYFDRLQEKDKKRLTYERLKLGLSNKRVVGTNSMKIFINETISTINDLLKTYKITPPPINTLSEALEFRSVSGNLNNQTKQIKDTEKTKRMFFLINNLNNFLYILNNQKGQISFDIENIYSSINSMLDIYHHNYPFLGINSAAISKNKNALLLMSLLDKDNIRYPFLVLDEKLLNREEYPQNEHTALLRKKIISKLIMHNFLACEVIFYVIENNGQEIFNSDLHLKFRLLDFDILFPVINTKKISAKRLVEDTLASLVLNLNLLKETDDDFIYHYLFSDIDNLHSHKLIQKPIDNKRVSCLDDVIRKTLEVKASKLPPSVQLQTEQFILDQLSSYSAIYKNLESASAIQKVWELVIASVVKEKSKQNPVLFNEYYNFYSQAHFNEKDSSEKGEFKKEIINTFVKTFYTPANGEIDLENCLSSFFILCGGEDRGNWGLKGVIDEYGSSDLKYIRTYRNASVDLLQKTLLGKGLNPGDWYICKIFYDNQLDKNKPIADSDLFSEEFFRVYEWIWESAFEFSHYPEIRKIFVDDDAWNKYTSFH
jgi:hypothetical protein